MIFQTGISLFRGFRGSEFACVTALRRHDPRFRSVRNSGPQILVRTAPENRHQDVRITGVRHRFHATSSRQPRQVRKEATVTGSCVCSGPPVSGFFLFQTPSRGSTLDRLTLFVLFAVTSMLVTYAFENRSRWFIFAFAISCMLGSIYGFLQGAWPFGAVEAVWSVVALRRWYLAPAAR